MTRLFAGKTYQQIFEQFNDPAAKVVAALVDGQPELLDWEISGHDRGCFRMLRFADGKPVEGALIINAPESRRAFYEASIDTTSVSYPVQLVFAGTEGGAE